MDVVYIFDNNYFHIALVSYLSLLKNYKGKKLYVHFVLVDVEKMNIELLETYSNANVQIFFYNYDTMLLSKFPNTAASKNTYIRLFLTQIIKPISNRILYLDCDTLVCDDISELAELNIGNKPLAMIPDFLPTIYTNLVAPNIYYNGGVILFDKEFFMNSDYQNQINQYLENNDISNLRFADQDLINHLFCNDIYRLDFSYNVTTPFFIFTVYKHFINALKNCSDFVLLNDSDFSRIKKSPKIIHFSGNTLVRPWYRNSVHPYAKLYQSYNSNLIFLPYYKSGLINRIDSMLRKILSEKVYSKIYFLALEFLAKKYKNRFVKNEK